MMAVDTSALMAIISREPQAGRCEAALASDPRRVISGGTVAEALIVAGRRNLRNEMARLIDALAFEVVPVTAAAARRVAAAYARWGRGFHPAGLNFGDCFSYAVATERACPLLYVGRDFSQTDIASALRP